MLFTIHHKLAAIERLANRMNSFTLKFSDEEEEIFVIQNGCSMELIKSRVISSNAHKHNSNNSQKIGFLFTSVKKLPASQTCSNTVAWELLFALDTRKNKNKKQKQKEVTLKLHSGNIFQNYSLYQLKSRTCSTIYVDQTGK